MRQFSGRGALCAVVAAALFLAAPAPAADLSIGLATEIGAMDPHLPVPAPNVTVLSHIFQPLVDFDATMKPTPALAVSWKAVDPLTWEFELRKDVKWHDGSDFTAEDVKFSIERMPGFSSPHTKEISAIEIAGPHTIRLRTTKPYPVMPADLANVLIISKAHGEAASTADFDSGKAMIGTGPYKFVERPADDRIVLEKNAQFWGGAPAWDKVEIRAFPDGDARVAGLLAHEVALIEAVPTAAVPRLKQESEVKLATTISDRFTFLQMDTGREARSPFVTDRAGNRMEKNPLRDPRVRAAISKAINREELVARLLNGQGVPAGQFLPETFFGASKKLAAPKHNPEAAKKLLVDAGYPEGFGITLHAPDTHEQLAQAIAEMLTQIGIDAQVEAMPTGTFLSRGANAEFSLALASWRAGSGGVAAAMTALLASFDPKKGTGIANRGRYANPALDAVLDQAREAMEEPAREMLLIEASEIAMQDHGLIPLFYLVNVWALRRDINFEARADGRTLAIGAKPSKG